MSTASFCRAVLLRRRSRLLRCLSFGTSGSAGCDGRDGEEKVEGVWKEVEAGEGKVMDGLGNTPGKSCAALGGRCCALGGLDPAALSAMDGTRPWLGRVAHAVIVGAVGGGWEFLRAHGHGPLSMVGDGPVPVPKPCALSVLLLERPPLLTVVFELLVLFTLRRSPVFDDVLPLSLARQDVPPFSTLSSLSESQKPLRAYMPLVGAPLSSASRTAAAVGGRAGDERALANSFMGVRGGAV